MIQWGHTSHSSASGKIEITFNIAFDTYTCFVCPILHCGDTESGSTYTCVWAITLTGFWADASTSNTSPKKPYYWLAIGY